MPPDLEVLPAATPTRGASVRYEIDHRPRRRLLHPKQFVCRYDRQPWPCPAEQHLREKAGHRA